jgi:prepilin-type N-terminal cleavage/methylation domain-containing protein
MLRRLVQDERGFSLTELLMSMVVGSIVLWAMMMLFTHSVAPSMEVGDRVEAQQRGRLAMDRVETVLNSQVCLDTNKPPVIAGDGQSVTVYADLGDEQFTPQQYRFVYDPAARTLTEQQFDGTGTVPNLTFPGTPSRSRIVGSGIVPDRVGGVQQPVFRYFKFETDGTVNPNNPLPTPLSTADAGKTIRVAVAFQALPERTNKEDPRATTLEGQAVVGSADPAHPTDGPNC